MSGKIVNNVFRASGVIAATPGGLDWSTAVVTGSTLSASAGKGYFINTTSNACTVTLPSSAEIGDQIVFADYARTWSTNNLIIDSNGNNFQGEPDTFTVDYSTAGQSLNIVYSDATKGWLPVSDDAVANVPVAPTTQKALFAFGSTNNGATAVATSNIVGSNGVVASDVSGVGTVRRHMAACTYGTDKGIVAYGAGGSNDSFPVYSLSNLISNSGVVAADVTGVGTARFGCGATEYGASGQAMFAYGHNNSNYISLKNLVTNQGVVGTDVTGVGTARGYVGAGRYGTGLGIFGYGNPYDSKVSTTNRVTFEGVIGSDVTGVGTVRYGTKFAEYGDGLGMFAFGGGGFYGNNTNRVSNTGVVSSDGQAAGTGRLDPSGSSYGGDKGIFGFGYNGSALGVTNLVNNTGTISADVSAVGTARAMAVATGFSISA
jgi:hypothetical protein